MTELDGKRFDPTADVARAAARQLSRDHGDGLQSDVEAILFRRELSGRVDQYLVDPLSLASLVVSIASLAWSVYSGRRYAKTEVSLEAIERTVLAEADETTVDPRVKGAVVTTVVTEIIRLTS
jgi:hypothetical protein